MSHPCSQHLQYEPEQYSTVRQCEGLLGTGPLSAPISEGVWPTIATSSKDQGKV